MEEDDEILENIEADIWFELSVAHRDLTTPRRSSSGLVNRHELIPYRFPPAVEVTGLSVLSDALVCRIRWSSPLVQNERDVILGREMEAMQAIEAWRTRAIKTAIRSYQIVKIVEMRAFGDKSFYHLKAMAQGGPIPAIPDDVDPEIEKEEE